MFKPGLNKNPDWKKVALVVIVLGLIAAAVRLHAIPLDSSTDSGAVIWLILAVLYFVPTIVASSRERKNRNAIFVTNLLFGWTLIGWGIALIWAVKEDR